MATPRFNDNILAAALRLHDDRTDPTANGDTGMVYSSAALSRYQNRAIRKIILETLQQFGERIEEMLPEIVKNTGTLTFAAGVVAKPTDCLRFLDLRRSTDSVVIRRVDKNISMATVQAAAAATGPGAPTATKPWFYEDKDSLYILPTSGGPETWSVKGRYLLAPADITPSTTAAGSGGGTNANVTYTASTKTLVSGASIFAASDVGKLVAFGSGTATYVGRILTYTNGTTVVLEGSFLPAGNLSTQTLVMVADSGSGDVALSPVWDDLIVEHMVNMGLADMQTALS